MFMPRKTIILAAAMAVVTLATAAHAGQWVYVPDNAAPQRYVDGSSRTYGPPPAQRRAYRQAPNASAGVYIQAETPFDDRCTYKRERGLFGGWEETRFCPD
jgi:hypothetical protein